MKLRTVCNYTFYINQQYVYIIREEEKGMSEYIIKNEKLQLTVSDHGAEIRSLIRLSDNR